MVTEHHVKVTGYAKTPATAVVKVNHLALRQRVVRALTASGLCFALAVVSVFIPAAHFVLVPLFLIAALVVLPVKLGQRSVVLGAHGVCPDCAAEQEIDMPVSWRLPVDVACRSCHRRLTLTPGDQAPAPS